MTEARLRILKTITAFIKREGMSPTVKEIAEATDMAISAVHSHLFPLQVGGYISRRPGTARSIQVLKKEVPEEARA